MSIDAEDRAVTVLIGALFLALILVLLTTVLQTNAVPNWNEGVEFEHNQRVQDDLSRLRDGIVSASADGNSRSAAVTLGTTYPDRVVLRNPSDPIGTLRTREPGTLTVGNATADGSVHAVWNGTPRTFSTRALEYEPSYNRYREAPVTVYENWLLYNEFDDTERATTEQRLIADNRIQIGLLSGQVQETRQGTTTVPVRPVSAPGHPVSVTNDTEPIVLRVPTQLTNETWASLLEEEYAGNGGHIVDQDYRTGSPYNTLILTLEKGVRYDLRLSNVGVGHGIPSVESHYLVASGDDTRVTDEDQRVKFAFEVRDKYDNPVSNAPVTFDAPSGHFEDANGNLVPLPVRTDPDGTVEVWYDADGTVGIHDVTAFQNFSADVSLPDRKKHEITVVNTGGAGTDASGLVELKSAKDLSSTQIQFTVDNRAGKALNLTGLRVHDMARIEEAPTEHTEIKDTASDITSVTVAPQSQGVVAVEGERPVFFGDPIELSDGLNLILFTTGSSLEIDSDDSLLFHVTLFYDHGLRASYDIVIFT